MNSTTVILIMIAVFVLFTIFFAAKKWTSWWNLVIVVLFPVFGFFFVLWDVWRATAETDKPLASVTSWSALFDKEKYDVVYLFVVAFVLAFVFSRLMVEPIGALFGFQNPGFPLSIHGVYFAQTVALAIFLLVTFYLVRREWLLPLCWGAISVVLGIGTRFLLLTLSGQIENVMFQQPYDVRALLGNFLYGVLFMGALLVAVRLWGVRLRSLMLGAVLGNVIFSQVAARLLYGNSFHLEAFLRSLTWDIVSGVIYGALFYAAFYLHFRSKELLPAPTKGIEA